MNDEEQKHETDENETEKTLAEWVAHFVDKGFDSDNATKCGSLKFENQELARQIRELNNKITARGDRRITARGCAPVANAGGLRAGWFGNATQAWRSEVAAREAAGMQPRQAVLSAHRDNPGLRERYVAEVNR